jgi:hypothetical protein
MEMVGFVSLLCLTFIGIKTSIPSDQNRAPCSANLLAHPDPDPG